MDLSLFFTLLLLGLLACASCETCSPEEDMAPCKCEPHKWSPGEIDVQCDGVSPKEVDDAFDNLRGKTIDTVYIKNVKGDRLSSLLFWNTRVRRIYILNCNLQGLSESDRKPPFLGLENSLEILLVTSSIVGDNQLKTLDLSHLKNLKSMIFNNDNVPEVGNDWFAKGPLSLTAVTIDYCGLSELGDNAFAPLANLRSLSLSGNRLISLKRSMLPNPASHLQSLYLSNNNIKTLSNDIFSGMPSLGAVYLQINSISRIEELTWSSMWEKLNALNLENNPLQCDSHMDWMFSQKQLTKLLGTCDSPASVKGERLVDFIEINRKSLSHTGKSSGSLSKEELVIG